VSNLRGGRFAADEEIGSKEAERLVEERRGTELTRTVRNEVAQKSGTPVVKKPAEQTARRIQTSQPVAKADCSALRNEFKKKTDEMTSRATRLNCHRDNNGMSAYSGCAMDVVGPFFPYWPDCIFSDEACKTGYAACMTGPFSAYLGCLDGCNSAFRSGGGDLMSCGQKCFQQIQAADKRCAGK